MSIDGSRRQRFLSSKMIGATLLSLSVLMLAATIGLGSVLMQQTRTLESNVALTQEAVDANVRTLGQVQRELLRLRILLAATTLGPAAIAQQEAFVDQRVQEGSLPYQGETLGSQELLDQSGTLADRWTTTVRPLVDGAVVSGSASEIAAALGQLTELEKAYNQLVSDGEINRKVIAGRANAATLQMLSQAKMLLAGLSLTAASFLAFMTVAGLASRRSRRLREQSAIELLALNAELRTHALVVHATDNLVVITDRDGRIEWVNDAFVRTTEYSLEAAKGRRPGEFLQGPKTDPSTILQMRQDMRDGRSFSVEVLNYSASGREYWVHIEAHPVRDDTGALTRFVAIQSDVTDRRRTEDTLRRATETALSLAQEKTAFLATMSHEIRTPLNAVLGVTSLLEGTPLNFEQREYVNTARRSGNLLLALINDILDFSALESGRIEVEKRAFSVPLLVADIGSMFASTADAAGLALTVEVDDTVPTAVCGDENRIRQVIVNLVANGLKFTQRGEVSVTVGQATTETGPMLKFAVQDSGIGIATDRQERIFQPFTQVDASTTREYGGTGLGLSICRLIAGHLHGTITVHSTPGVGSTFTFLVPVDQVSVDLVPVHQAQVHPDPVDQVPVNKVVDGAVAPTAGRAGPAIRSDPVETASAAPDTASSLRVLLAEDDATNRMVALRMLSRLGITADWACDGVDAVIAVHDQDYDLVLMDVHMPRLDGLAATEQIHSMDTMRTRPKIVALTANALEGDIERLLAAGMDGYLSKPVTIGTLSTMLAALAAGEPLPSGRR